MEYRYWVVRYVANLAREEFVNVGVVCGADEADWAVRFDLHEGDRRIGGGSRGLRSWARWFERRLESLRPGLVEAELAPTSWIEGLREREQSAIRFSAPRPIESDSAESAVELLFPLLVERDSTRRSHSRTRASMRGDLLRRFELELGFALERTLFSRPTVTIGAETGRFDIARESAGDGLVLTNVSNFAARDVESVAMEARAANWLVHRIREGGAEIALPDLGDVRVGQDTRVEAVYEPPRRGRGDAEAARLLESTQEAWETNGVTARSFDEVMAAPAQSLV